MVPLWWPWGVIVGAPPLVLAPKFLPSPLSQSMFANAIGFAMLLAAYAVLFYPDVRFTILRRRIERASSSCHVCNYDRNGLVDDQICPECGTPPPLKPRARPELLTVQAICPPLRVIRTLRDLELAVSKSADEYRRTRNGKSRYLIVAFVFIPIISIGAISQNGPQLRLVWLGTIVLCGAGGVIWAARMKAAQRALIRCVENSTKDAA